MHAMRPDRWPFVPTTLSLILVAAGAADGRALMMSDRDVDWSLLVRADSEFLGGLWLLGGLSPRWARWAAVAAFAGILACDLAVALAGFPARHAFGRVAVGPGWVLARDLTIIAALLRWRPAAGGAARIDSHPGRVAGAALIAAALGVAIDGARVGQYPIVTTARAGGSSSGPELDYLVYLPEGYHWSSGRWPLILALHGAGAVGRDIARVESEGLPRCLQEHGGIPFIVVAPQSPGRGWSIADLDALLDEVLGWYRVDEDRVYLTGLSMGAYGAWALAAAHPGRFAAMAPICGGGDPAVADRLRSVPAWAFHGAEDTVVPPEESRRMIAALERAGGEARLTVYPGVGHDSATRTYVNPELYEWFLAHRRRVDGVRPRAATTPPSAAESGATMP